jgi:penicillin-binding protein 1A
MDQPVTIRVPGGGGVWQPSDVSPPSYAPMTLRSGLAYSKNTITAQLMEKVGPERVIRLAQALGVRSSKLEPVLSLALGTSPVTLREMVAAYGAIAGGYFIEPNVITRVEDRKGKVLVELQAKREPVDALPRPQALELVNAMRGVIDEGTASAIRYRYGITADVAGKTGTTQENTDGWFIMMHPHLVAGARVGFNDKLTMGNWGQGARSALPIVGEVFQQALRHRVIDQGAEFAIPRRRAPPPPEPLPGAEPSELGTDLSAQPSGAEPFPFQNVLPPQTQAPPPTQRQFEPQLPPQPQPQPQPRPAEPQPAPPGVFGGALGEPRPADR